MLTFIVRQNMGVDKTIADANASIAQSNQVIAQQEARRVQQSKAPGIGGLLSNGTAGYQRTLGGGNSLSATA